MACLTETPLCLIRGDTKTYDFTFYLDTAQTTPLNLTGAKVWFTIKRDYQAKDADALVDKQLTITNAALGKATVKLSQTDTALSLGTYYYDVQYVSLGDLEVKTVIKGKIQVQYDVKKGIA